MGESVPDDLHPADAELTADWKENKHHLSLDRDLMMMEQNPEQVAAFRGNSWLHLLPLSMPGSGKDNGYMMKCLLCLLKNTEISAFKNSYSILRKQVA